MLPHDLASAAVARRHVTAMLHRQGVSPDRCDDAALVVSELVGNALRHARPLADGTLRVRWRVQEQLLTVEVTDGGSESRPAPRAAVADAAATSGRGLGIIDVISQSWGVREEPFGTTVWAVVPAPPLRWAGRPSAEELQDAG